MSQADATCGRFIRGSTLSGEGRGTSYSYSCVYPSGHSGDCGSDARRFHRQGIEVPIPKATIELLRWPADHRQGNTHEVVSPPGYKLAGPDLCHTRICGSLAEAQSYVDEGVESCDCCDCEDELAELLGGGIGGPK